MSRRMWSLVLVAALLVSSLFVIAAPLSTTAASPTGTGSSGLRPAAGFVVVYPYSGYGYTTSFFPGSSPSGTLYFAVHDTSGATSATVTLTDPNATRDSVGSPAFHATVPIGPSGWYYSWLSGGHYTFPNLPVGGIWNLTASAANASQYNTTITISTFSTDLVASVFYGALVVPGESVTLSYFITSDYTEGNYYGVTNLTLYGQYFGKNDSLQPIVPGEFTQRLAAGTATGMWTFDVPDNATPNMPLNFTLSAAVVSNGRLAERQSSNFGVYIGIPTVEAVYVSETPNLCAGYSGGQFVPGETVFGCVEAGASFYGGGGFTGVPGLALTFGYWNGTGTIAPSGATTQATTNSSGFATFSFTPTSPPFRTSVTLAPSLDDAVNITASDPVATNHGGLWNWTAAFNETFYLGGNAATGDIAVSLDRSTYAPGANVTVHWALGSSDPATVGNLSAQSWEIASASTGLTLAVGTISSSATVGSFSAALPAGFLGPFDAYVYGTNGTVGIYGYSQGYVSPPTLVLANPSEYYGPGSTVSVTAAGNFLPSGATIGYIVTAYYYTPQGYYQNQGIVGSGTVANGSSFSISVPSADPPGEYQVEAWVTAPGGSIVATATQYSYLSSGYSVLLGIQTLSKYSDGSFQPGETVTFTYSITAYGAAALPSIVSYQAAIFDTVVALSFQGGSTSGTFQLTIPSNQPAGAVEVEFGALGQGLNGPNCSPSGCSGYTFLIVNPNPSALSLDLAPGSGVTVGWLILLVLIAVVAIALGLLLIRRRRTPPATGSSAPPPNVMSPPAPAPSSPAPPEWKEPQSTTAGQPPMPEPPSGSA